MQGNVSLEIMQGNGIQCTKEIGRRVCDNFVCLEHLKCSLCCF
ncbi:unnamed protein product [Arabidopsis halleri]